MLCHQITVNNYFVKRLDAAFQFCPFVELKFEEFSKYCALIANFGKNIKKVDVYLD